MSQQLHFTLLVTGPPYGSQQASSAYQFAQALLEQQHQIDTIFFYYDGVYNANVFTSPASDEFNLVKAWENLGQQHHIPLHICSAAALRRGVIDYPPSHNPQIGNLSSSFMLSGLGSLAQAVVTSDRVIQF